MTKLEFLDGLRQKIKMLPYQDVEKSLEFYGEMIDDYMDDGISEQEAVEKIGSINEVSKQILVDAPIGTLIKARITPSKPLPAWAIITLILTSPIWFCLAIALVTVVFSLFVCVWTVGIVIYAVTVALGASAIGLLLGAVIVIINGSVLSGVLFVGGALVCGGLTIFMFYASKYLPKYIFRLSGYMFKFIKSMLIAKGE